MLLVPLELYGKKEDLRFGVSRGCGYLLRLRMEYLADVFDRPRAPDEPIGLRRAIHVGALIEVVYTAHQKEFSTGYFNKELKRRIDHCLQHTTLQPQERYFGRLDWWDKLDRAATLKELGANLKRLIDVDELTTCLCIGIEMHALFDMRMRHVNSNYESVITPDRIERSPFLRESIARFRDMIPERNAA